MEIPRYAEEKYIVAEQLHSCVTRTEKKLRNTNFQLLVNSYIPLANDWRRLNHYDF